ncbi:hypothetical protein DW946_11510 [Bacteroides caccae]|nr:hypothetical protein DW946_11510 [Bacteroides caccae]
MCPINKRRIIKNTLFLYLKVIVNTIVLLYSTSLILNALGVIDYGIYGVVGGVIAMLGYLNTAMAKTTQRFLSFAEGKRDKAKQKVVFNTSVMLHLGIGVSIFILMELFIIRFLWNFEYSRGTYGCCSVYLSYDGGEHFIYNPYGSL